MGVVGCRKVWSTTETIRTILAPSSYRLSIASKETSTSCRIERRESTTLVRDISLLHRVMDAVLSSVASNVMQTECHELIRHNPIPSGRIDCAS